MGSIQDSHNNDNHFVLFCPSKLAEDEKISDGAIRTYLLISNFLNRDGYAFCSNEWLAERRKTTVREIQRQLEELEKGGYLYREIYSKGFHKQRRIWEAGAYAKYLLGIGKEDEEFKKCLRDDHMVTSDTTTRSPPITTTRSPIINKYNSKEEATSSAAVSLSPPKEEKKAPTPSFSEEELSLFDPRRSYLKGKSADEIRRIKIYYEKKKHTISNPTGWLIKCIEGQWYASDTLSDADLQKNFKYARDFEEKFNKDHSCAYTYVDVSASQIVIVKAGEEIHAPVLEMNHERFKAQFKETIKENFNYEKVLALLA